MEKVTRFGVSIPPELLERFDPLIKEKGYANRSEAIRDLIRDFLVSDEWKKSREEGIGSLTIVYGHDVRGVQDKLTDLQHRHHSKVISSMHVHLDEHNCMEILVIKGRMDEIKGITNGIISSKGVKHGKLVMTTTGKGLA